MQATRTDLLSVAGSEKFQVGDTACQSIQSPHRTSQCIRANSSFECSTFVVPRRARSGVQWRDTVRDSAYVRARSARGISKNMQKYEKLEKIGEGELFAVEVAGDERRPATQYRRRYRRRPRRLATRLDSSPGVCGVRRVPSSSVFHSFCQRNSNTVYH